MNTAKLSSKPEVEKIRVMIVDDHVLMRMGLVFALNNQPDIEVVGESGTAAEALALYQSCRPDVVILDLRFPKGSGIETLGELRSKLRDVRVLILTNYGSGDEIAGALAAGATGFLLKDAPSTALIDAVRDVSKGIQHIPRATSGRLASSLAVNLSHREVDVLQLISKGMSNKEIADTLKLTESTIKGHVTGLLSKLGVCDRTQAVVTAYKRGLIHLD